MSLTRCVWVSMGSLKFATAERAGIQGKLLFKMNQMNERFFCPYIEYNFDYRKSWQSKFQINIPMVLDYLSTYTEVQIFCWEMESSHWNLALGQ